MWHYYRVIRKKAGISNKYSIKNGRGVCLHCFRHSFSVRVFDKNGRNWVKASESVPFLSTYLGHDSLYETEKYIKYSGDYFEDTLTKFTAFSGDLFPEVIFDELEKLPSTKMTDTEFAKLASWDQTVIANCSGAM